MPPNPPPDVPMAGSDVKPEWEKARKALEAVQNTTTKSKSDESKAEVSTDTGGSCNQPPAPQGPPPPPSGPPPGPPGSNNEQGRHGMYDYGYPPPRPGPDPFQRFGYP